MSKSGGLRNGPELRNFFRANLRCPLMQKDSRAQCHDARDELSVALTEVAFEFDSKMANGRFNEYTEPPPPLKSSSSSVAAMGGTEEARNPRDIHKTMHECNQKQIGPLDYIKQGYSHCQTERYWQTNQNLIVV